MKKSSIILVAFIMLSFAFTFAGCGAKKYNLDFWVDGQIYQTIQTSGKETLQLPEDPTKDNFIFSGWYEDENVWRVPFTSTSLSNKSLKENKNIYAKWEAIPNQAHIQIRDFSTTDNENYKYKVSNSTLTLNFNNYITVSNSFTWFLSFDISGIQQIPSKAVELNVGNNIFYATFVSDTGSLTIFTFSIRRCPIYTVSFNPNNGSEVITQFVEEGQVLTPINQPIKIGYIFNGWDADTTTPITNNTQFNALWLVENYNIIYYLNEGENNNENPLTYNIESDAITLLNATREHYVFDGWYTEGNFVNRITTIQEQSYGNKKLYAKWSPYNYSITYIANGGINNQLNPNSYNIESDQIVLKDASRTSYAFAGWYKNEELTEQITSINKGSFGNIKLYAKWTPINYNITYHLNGGENNTANPSTYNIESGSIILKTPTKDGYNFDGWYSESTFNNKQTSIQLNANKDLDLYAKWSAVVYPINYVLDGGTNNTKNPSTFTIESNTIVLENPTKTNYNFDGWYTDDLFTTKIVAIQTGTYGNLKLYAKWVPAGYRINYNLNGGVNNLNNPKTYTVDTQNITLFAPSRTGYDFAGWYKEAIFKNRIQMLDTSNGGDVEIFAKWNLINYSITYILNGGTNNKNNLSQYNIESETISLNAASKDGYTFAGWFTDNEYKNPITSIETGRYGNLTLYAKYDLVDYNITYTLNGGINKENPTKYNVEQEDITLLAPSRTGYNFDGWYTENTCENKVQIIETSLCKNITLYAKWSPVTYTITYHLDGGINHENNPKTYTIESQTITLEPASKTGYNFDGWYTDENFENLITSIETGGTQNLKLYAKFYLVEFTITYHLDGGKNSENNPSKYSVLSDEIVLENAIKNGANFAGWFTDENFTNEILEINVKGEGNINLYAKWDYIKYLITYHLDNGKNSQNNPATYTIIDNSITLEAAAKEHYNFEGWFIDKELTTELKTITSGSTGNLDLYAKWVPTIYTITYNLNNGVNHKDNPEIFTYFSEEIILLEPTRDGYIFTGWSTSSEYFAEITKIPQNSESSVVVWATWQAIFVVEGNSITGITEFAQSKTDLYTLTIPAQIDGVNITNLDYLYSTSIRKLVISEGIVTVNGFEMRNLLFLSIPASLTHFSSISFCPKIYECINKSSQVIDIRDTIRDVIEIESEEKTNLYEDNGFIFLKQDNLDVLVDCLEITKSIILPQGLNSNGYEIEKNLFKYNEVLQSITIPTSVKGSGYDAFYECSRLKEVYYQGTIEEWMSIGFYSSPLCNGAYLYINNELVVDLILTDSTTVIDNLACCTSIKSLTIPTSITSFKNSFYGCYNLVAVYYLGTIEQWFQIEFAVEYDLPHSLTRSNPLHNGGYLYINNEKIVDLVIPNSIKEINSIAFGGSSLKSVSFEANSQITSIAYAFYNCKSLESITIPSSVTEIGKYAFYGCASLKSVTFDEDSTLQNIGDYAFYGCISLESITIPSSVINLGNIYAGSVFSGCNNLKTVLFENGSNLKQIGESVFQNCTSLKNITIPNSVTAIGNYAFKGCTSLETVFYEGTEIEWNSINIGSNNSMFTDATRYYYSETEPTDEGNFWRYVDGVPTIW